MYLCLSVFRLYVPVLILLLNQFNNFPQKIEIISEINIWKKLWTISTKC